MNSVDVAAAERVHFIGIGGIGMSGIARLLLKQPGIEVSGSEGKHSEMVEVLRGLGAHVVVGHCAENVHGATQIVRTSAVKNDNPEIVEATRLGISILHRSQKLAELFNNSKGISVAGTHGKTTTSSLGVVMFREAGVDVSYIVGGIVDNTETNADFGTSGWTIIEADESDGSLVNYQPQIAIVTNLEMDHADFYASLEDIREVFRRHIASIHSGGSLIWCADCAELNALIPTMELSHLNTLSYGLNDEARLRATDITYRHDGIDFCVSLDGVHLGKATLALLGRHNVQNALSVIGAGLQMGVPFEKLTVGLNAFGGAHRRFHVLAANAQGVPLVVDDYAHHPSEIKATLLSARQALGNRRLVVAFQPHRYSRTQSLMEEFAGAFGQADKVILTPIYSAGEAPIDGVSAGNIATLMRRLDDGILVATVGDLAELQETLSAELADANTSVLLLGAGDISKIAGNLARALHLL